MKLKDLIEINTKTLFSFTVLNKFFLVIRISLINTFILNIFLFSYF